MLPSFWPHNLQAHRIANHRLAAPHVGTSRASLRITVARYAHATQFFRLCLHAQLANTKEHATHGT